MFSRIRAWFARNETEALSSAPPITELLTVYRAYLDNEADIIRTLAIHACCEGVKPIVMPCEYPNCKCSAPASEAQSIIASFKDHGLKISQV